MERKDKLIDRFFLKVDEYVENLSDEERLIIYNEELKSITGLDINIIPIIRRRKNEKF